jgi:glycerophosphoryl diester phosphodiesterase
MKILSHRGYWKNQEEKNSLVAFERSFERGYGIETDIRDLDGHLIVSHDYVTYKSDIVYLRDLLELIKKFSFNSSITIALNIKADGLANLLKSELDNLISEDIDFFAFDMSVPDMREYFNNKFKVYSRVSEVERNPSFYDQCSGVWLDSFNSNWFDVKVIKRFLDDSKKVCIVSSELHSREKSDLWDIIYPLRREKNLTLCTDLPEEATAFFN